MVENDSFVGYRQYPVKIEIVEPANFQQNPAKRLPIACLTGAHIAMDTMQLRWSVGYGLHKELRNSEIESIQGTYGLRLFSEYEEQLEILGVYRAGHDADGAENHTLIMMFYADKAMLAYRSLARAMVHESAAALQPYMRTKWGVEVDLGIATSFTTIEPSLSSSVLE